MIAFTIYKNCWLFSASRDLGKICVELRRYLKKIPENHKDFCNFIKSAKIISFSRKLYLYIYSNDTLQHLYASNQNKEETEQKAKPSAADGPSEGS